MLGVKASFEGDAHIIKEDRSAPDDVAPHIVETRPRYARGVSGDNHGGDSSGAAVRAAPAGGDDENIGAVGEGDRRLFAREDIENPLAACAELEVGRVRPAPWLAHAKTQQ